MAHHCQCAKTVRVTCKTPCATVALGQPESNFQIKLLGMTWRGIISLAMWVAFIACGGGTDVEIYLFYMYKQSFDFEAP